MVEETPQARLIAKANRVRERLRADRYEVHADTCNDSDDAVPCSSPMCQLQYEAETVLKELTGELEAALLPQPAPRLFPVMGGPAIPWSLIAPHERQAEHNHGQSLERLATRGGLSPCEALAVLEDREWHTMPKAREVLVEYLRSERANDEAARLALLPQPAERPSIEAVLDDLQSCVQNIECDCLDPPEDREPPENADDYRAHSQYCRRYLFGYIGMLRAALASPPVEPRAWGCAECDWAGNVDEGLQHTNEKGHHVGYRADMLAMRKARAAKE